MKYGKLVILVPHHDDEILFCWGLLKEAVGVGFLVDGGYTRTTETRVELVARFPHLHLGFAREMEPLPTKAAWEVAPPLSDAALRHGVDMLVSWAMALGATEIAIPGRNARYGHPHHLQLEAEMDARFGAGIEEELPVDDLWIKRAVLLDVYASEARGLIDHNGWPADLWADAVDPFRLYYLESR